MRRLLTIFLFFWSINSLAAIKGVDYTVREGFTPSNGKIEVLDFYSYSCFHCSNLYPVMQKWSKEIDKGKIDIKRIQVVFDERYEPLARLAYAIDHGFNNLEKAAYDAIINKGIDLSNASKRIEWLKGNGVDSDKFESIYNSFAANNSVKEAKELTKEYNVEATPTIVINGRYVLKAATPDRLIEVSDEIIRDIMDNKL